jgi:hypothetical protein
VNVVPFKDQAFYNILLARHDQNLDAQKAFWGAVRESDKPKIFVGPDRLGMVAVMLRALHLCVPLINAFSEYEKIKKWLLEREKPGAIFIFSAGMPSKAWIAELLQACPDISCLDAGSAFDPLCLEANTRTEQLPHGLVVNEYLDWLEE